MIWLYRLLFLPALFIALPNYLFRMWRRGGYGGGFAHRFGLIERLPPPPEGTVRIWLQAVSVGEVLAIGPLLKMLVQDPSIEIVLTTTTSTGYAEARKRYGELTRFIGIFPLDFWPFNRSAWQRIQPGVIALTESELWPEHLHRAKRNEVPAFLINARLSDRSFRRYEYLRGAAGRLLHNFTKIYPASSLDEGRFRKLGCPEGQILQTGSIKFDVGVGQRLTQFERERLRAELGFKAGPETAPFVLVGASTWPGEEEALLDAQLSLRKRGIDCRLLLVPRHAERGSSLTQNLKKQPLTWFQRSSRGEPPGETHVYLADTTGELSHLMQAGDLAFVGKSLPPNEGGQTPIEAAGLGLPVLFGPNMTNFSEVSQSLLRCGAASLVVDRRALVDTCLQLALDGERRGRMRHSSLDWHAVNRGSSQRIADNMKQLLSRGPNGAFYDFEEKAGDAPPSDEFFKPKPKL